MGAVELKNSEMSVLATEKVGHLKSSDVGHSLLVVLLININGLTHQSLNGKLGLSKKLHGGFLLHLTEEDIAAMKARTSENLTILLENSQT